MQKLALTVAMGVGETPTSYASRLAARNFVSARDLVRDFGLSFQRVSDGDAHAIRLLARLGGADFEKLMSNAIQKFGSTFVLRGEQIANNMIRRARVHVCPSCIKDDVDCSALPPNLAAYGRAEWTIPFFRTCAKHAVALVQVGSISDHHEFHDFARNIAPALPDIDRFVDAAQRRPPSSLEDYLLRRLQGSADSLWLDTFPFFAAAALTEVVGAVAVFGKRVKLDDLSEDDRYQAGTAGFDILKAGPTGIDQFMTKLKREHVPKRSGSPDGLRVTYGTLYTRFGHGRLDPVYDSVRAAMAEHILAHFPLGPGDKLFQKPVENRRFHSIRTASKTFRMHEKRLRKLIKAEGLITDPSTGDQHVLFDAKIADRLFKRESDSLSMTQVTTYINATRSVADNLLRDGLIKHHKVGMPGMPHVFFRSELDEFLASLYRRTEAVTERGPEMCDLMSARRCAYASTAQILRLILDGSLWAGRTASSRGVFGLLVKINEVQAFTEPAQIGGVFPSYLDAELKIHSKAITQLLKRKILRTVVRKHPVNGRPMKVVPHQEIKRFNEEFVSLHVLAQSQGKFAPDLLNELHALGVRPAFDGLEATLFRRSDLSK